MIYCKQILKLWMAVLMAYLPIQAHADEIMDNAQKVVEQSLKAAEADALLLVKEDYMVLIGDLARQIAREADRDQLYQVYVRYIEEATTQFEEVSLSAADNELTWDLIEKYKEQYQDAIRKQFVASWIPAHTDAILINTREMIKTLLLSFKNQCEVGRGDADKSYFVPSLATPPYVSSLKGKVNPNPLGAILGGSPIDFQFSYTSATAGSQAANHDRAVAVNAAVTASNIANAAWLSSQFSAIVGTTGLVSGAGAAGSALAAVNAALVAAAPYLIAVAVVVMVVADVMARSEAAKLANRINQAQHHMDKEVADHLDVEKFYRQQCGEYVALMENFVVVFADLEDSVNAAARIATSEQKKEEIQQWEADSKQNNHQICQQNLAVLYTNHGCTQIPADQIPKEWVKSHVMDENKPETFCFVDSNQKVIEAAHGDCLLPFDESKRSEIVKTANEKMNEYGEKYPKEKVTELVAAKLTLAFSDPKSIRNKLQGVSLDRMNDIQEKAFQNLMRLMRVKREMQALSEGQKALALETKVQNQFFDYRDQLMDIGVRIQDVIFGKDSQAEVLAALRGFSVEIKPFVDQYRHIDEVLELKRTVNYVIDLVEGFQ